MATVGGSECLNKSLAIVEVLGLSKSAFMSIEEEVGTLKAGAEKRRLATERGAA